jgi:hypothetical protein
MRLVDILRSATLEVLAELVGRLVEKQ